MGDASDIDGELIKWDTVEANEPLDWDTVDTDSDDDIRDKDDNPYVTSDQRTHLQEQFNIICTVWAAIIEAITLATKRAEPIAYHTSILSGRGWILELLNGHPERIRTELGVHKHIFKLLVEELQQIGYTHSKYVTLQEQLGIFLYITVTGLTTRHVGERFQWSNGTISNGAPTPPFIRENTKFFPFFEDMIGAIDGMHIACNPAADERDASRNRKGFTSQNCLVCCDFDLFFTYVLSGWEGSMADASIYHDARLNDLKIPDGKYYLADTGFPSCPQLLVPHRGQRYHLAEWGCTQTRPENSQELFNLCHAVARNVIERIIGVLKHCFCILVVPPKYSMHIQAHLPPALACIHNFICTWDPVDIDDPEVVQEAQDVGMVGSIANGVPTNAEHAWMSAKRDEIAACMWASYIAERARRGGS
ncbi:hypothetical protein PISMIDRAFT_18263 [Pisolithus microcarpus 441]|uniref:DDE Tnp4 domain-containing protein n=1 Tax=Pisolithus microcarpus 441 TaxID=765257 RepID=A0A0C9YGM5_9AGAM|nr:hypothetical protein PISMIDRAFT_18263 [Pisolithus microcarpus 441]